MPEAHVENRYSIWVGMVFIFNIIVGTGALTLPAAFAKAGWALGAASLLFLGFVSFINATYVIECMACVNAIIKSNCDSPTPSEETSRLIDNEDEVSVDSSINARTINRFFTLDKRVELGEMANILFSRWGRIVFYVTMVIYLYGDLSIYSAAIGKSTMDVICTHSTSNFTKLYVPFDLPCFNATDPNAIQISRLNCYRIVLTTFILILGPFVFFNVQKTKHLQIFTTIMRWLAFAIMIILAVRTLVTEGKKGNPPVFDMSGIPALFGACIYSFMCHHSLPGMITPIASKKRMWSMLSVDFVIIGLFYTLLALTGIFAFEHLEDLYTLNFISNIDQDAKFLQVLKYFLALFPVFTLSTTFPVIGITLRNNIQSIFFNLSDMESHNLFIRRFLFPLIAIIPPIIITMFFEDITILVSITGSYAGTGIQYLIPTFLVLQARKECQRIFQPHIKNPYESPFKHSIWTIFIFAWSIICIIMVSLNLMRRSTE